MAKKQQSLKYEPLYKPKQLRQREQERKKKESEGRWAVLVRRMTLGLLRDRRQ